MTVTNSTLRRYAAAGWALVQPRPVTEAALRPTWVQVAVWAGLLVISASLALFNFHSFQLGAYQDDADYVILARSLVYADHYGLMNTADGLAPANFPFGYPLLLAGVERIWPGNVDALRAISLVATLLTVSLLFWGWPLLSTKTSRWWGLAVAGLYALAPVTIVQAHITMSEPVFTCAALGAWLLTEWGQRQTWNSRRATLVGLGLGVVLTLVIFTRAIGLVFVGVVCLRYALTYGWRAWRSLSLLALSLLVTTAALLAVTPVAAADLLSSNVRYVGDYVGVVQGSNRYPTEVDIPYSILVLRRAYTHVTRDMRALILPLGGGAREREIYAEWGLPILRDWVGWVLGLVVIAGFFDWLRREGLTTFLLAVMAYWASIALWDWVSTRFLYPVQFQLFFAFLLGVHWLVGQVKRVGWPVQRWQALATIGTVVALGCISFYKSSVVDDSRLHTGDLSVRTQWITAHTDPAAVLMSEQGGIDYLYSQRPTVRFPPDDAGADAVLAYMTQHQVKYVVLAPALKWLTPYVPGYDIETKALKPVLDKLVQANRLRQANTSADGWIVTYEVLSH
jgi:hypothetical protein